MAYRTPIYAQSDPNAVPFAALQGFGGRAKEITDIFGPGGPLSTIPGYQPRHAQMDLANGVWQSIQTRRHLVGEAGTGCGKSFGYLVPAIIHAVSTGRKVVVSTANLALMDQLKKKDLPTLQRVMEPYLVANYKRNFRWMVSKGKGNYLCVSKLNDPNNSPPYELEMEADQIRDWADKTQTGDLDESGVNLKSEKYFPLRVAFAVVDRDDCPGPKKCDHGAASYGQGLSASCFHYDMKSQLDSTDIIVVNHHLLIMNRLLGGTLLPPHDVVVVDEAHQLEDIIRDQLEMTISSPSLNRLMNKIAKKKEVNKEDLEPPKEPAKLFFEALDGLLRENLERYKDKVRIYKRQISDDLIKKSNDLMLALEPIAIMLEAVEQPGVAEDVRGWCDALRFLAKVDGTMVMWGELPVGRSERLMGLKMQPIDIAPWCKENMAGRPWILTSATLATTTNPESQFSYIKATLGIEHCTELNVGSPYDYSKQALYYVPNHSMDVMERVKVNGKVESGQAYNERWAKTFAPEYKAILDATEGRALLLFTSRAAMEQMAYCLSSCKWPQKQQGDMPNPDLVDWLKRTPHSVLLATASFWEGVDIPGDALSCVVIDRLPFPPPDDPIIQARGELMGGSKVAFQKLSVPKSTIRMKQAIGRLIRTEQDRGLVAVMDVRLRHKDYGERMLLSFPGAPGRPGTPYKLIRMSDFPMVTAFINRGKRSPSTAWEQHAARALVELARADGDRAGELNGVGFSKMDTDIGNSLAEQLRIGGRLTGKQWGVAVELAHRYRRQVPIPQELQEVG